MILRPAMNASSMMRSCLLAALASAAVARAADVSDNANLWVSYFGDHPIGTNRWGIHLEGQARLADMGDR